MSWIENIRWLQIFLALVFIASIVFAFVLEPPMSFIPLGILLVNLLVYLVFKFGLNSFVSFLASRDSTQQLTLLDDDEDDYEDEYEEDNG